MTTPQVPSASAGLDAWLSYLEQLHPSAIDMGLARVQTVAERLQLTQTDAHVFMVAGTNGKGSTVRYLETILNCADRSEEHTSELKSRPHLVCRLLLEKK